MGGHLPRVLHVGLACMRMSNTLSRVRVSAHAFLWCTSLGLRKTAACSQLKLKGYHAVQSTIHAMRYFMLCCAFTSCHVIDMT